MIGSQVTSRQIKGRHRSHKVRGRQQAERLGPNPEALKLRFTVDSCWRARHCFRTFTLG